MYGHYVSSAGYTYHPPVVPVLSVADMIPPPPPPPGEGPLEGKLVYLHFFQQTIIQVHCMVVLINH